MPILSKLLLVAGLAGCMLLPVGLRAAPAAAAPAVFPAKVSAKYASQSAGQARMHTCLDQYNANKTAHANGGLEWIQKGGGYYSACSKKLKG